MYNLPYFKEKDQQVLLQFMKQHSFAVLIGIKELQPVATQVPFLFEEREGKLFLQGHIMRQTDHHKAFMDHPNVLCVFTGPHTYVSASWYTQQQTASTWNYMSVHAKGHLTFLDDAALLDILEKTTNHYEGHAESPAAFKNLDEDYIQRLIKAIVGIEIEVTEMDHVFKLSQNRDESSYRNIVEELEKGDSDAKQIAKEMKHRQSSLFNPL
jgi:transcriptional regulator